MTKKEDLLLKLRNEVYTIIYQSNDHNCYIRRDYESGYLGHTDKETAEKIKKVITKKLPTLQSGGELKVVLIKNKYIQIEKRYSNSWVWSRMIGDFRDIK